MLSFVQIKSEVSLMKRIAVFGFLAVFPLTLLAAPSRRYVVTTTHPYDVAERELPREERHL